MHMSAEQTITDHATLWDCGHTHPDGGTRACSTMLDFECATCIDEHIRSCQVCSR